jgi:site-specific recombinase XerD
MSREYSDERSVLVPVVVSEWSDQFGLAQATAGFLAGYGDVTRRAYALDLKQRTRWCSKNDLDVLEVRRAHIELFARSMEEEGRARSTVARRLSTIAGFYRYCVEEQLIASSPAAHVRRPRIDYESRAVGLDRNELGMFLVQAGLSGGRDHALACLFALNGLRVSEALNSNIENLGLQRGHHRTLTITRKGGKIVTVPLATRTARTGTCASVNASREPILTNHDGTRRMDRHTATRIVKRLAKRAVSRRTSRRIHYDIHSSPQP